MKKIISFFFLLSFLSFAQAQIPTGYYDAAAGLSGLPLKTALHNIIKNHTIISYGNLYNAYVSTDNMGNNIVWDIYSDIPSGTPPYTFSYSVSADQCGSYSTEGDCFNREHTWPQSWFGGSTVESDLFNVYPTDGYVNNRRANYPYGEVTNATWTSLNGSKVGPCTFPGYTSTVFEPIDEYKGDLARNYFYITVRYYTEGDSWPGSDMTTGTELKPWALNMMYQWHINDPVSQKEINRNNAVYLKQHNRNPFIDHPEWVGVMLNLVSVSDPNSAKDNMVVYPNPTSNEISISTTNPLIDVELYNSVGKKVIALNDIKTNQTKIDISVLSRGFYMLQVHTEKEVYSQKIVKY